MAHISILAQKIKIPAFLLICFFLLPTPARAQRSESSSGPIVIKIFPERQQERKSSRWSLASWMKTKEKIAEQNRWLWAHTNKMPVEWALAYGQSPTRMEVEGDLFFARLGLRMTHSKKVGWLQDHSLLEGPDGHSTELAAQLRLFGGNLQDSYLIARIGYEYSEWSEPSALAGGAYGAWFAEGALQLYFEQWIGAIGSWKYRYTGSHVSRRSEELSGNTREMGAFLELGALRFEGAYRLNNDQYSVNNANFEYNEWLARVRLHY